MKKIVKVHGETMSTPEFRRRVKKLHTLPGYTDIGVVTEKCRRIMDTIKDNKLDTTAKYQRFRSANPKLRLPHHKTVERNWRTKGWNW